MPNNPRPHEVHPYVHSTERRYLPSWRVYRNERGVSCLGPSWLGLVVSQLTNPILNCFAYFLWVKHHFYVLTESEFSFLAMLVRPYPVSGSAYLPQIPNQLHGMSKCAHEVLGTVHEAILMLLFTIQPIGLSICD